MRDFTAIKQLAYSLTNSYSCLDKHGNRPGSSFPKATGGNVSKNKQGQFQLDDVITHPESTYYRLTGFLQPRRIE